MSDGEESIDQMDANDTNENSVGKMNLKEKRLEIHFFHFNLQNFSVNSRMNLRLKVPIKKRTWTTIAARDLISC